jgi:hypothetical protein
MHVKQIVSRGITTLWRADRPLTIVGTLMLAAAALFAAAMAVDGRTITGAPAWLKPFKFAVSTAIYSLTLAWVFTWLPGWPRVRRIVGRTTATVFVLEVVIIAAQAWRGTTSHFNVGTPLDASLFFVMGAAIFAQTLSSVAVAVALWRQTLHDPAMMWALRFGMVITIAGAMTGPLMTRPTEAQLADARAGGRMTVSGAHTVGGPDGGPGLPVTGWSREHGDIRVPHFVGLHALQVLPLFGFALRRGRYADGRAGQAMIALAMSYAVLFGLLLVNALRGNSVIAPDPVITSSLAAWLITSIVALAWIAYRPGSIAGMDRSAV